jgi:hypothetical protein
MWRLVPYGTKGHVSVLSNRGRFSLYFFGSRYPYNGDNFGSPAWSRAKERLPFCRVHQDGSVEGVLCMDRLPTAAEGAVIRKVLGIRKRRPVSLHLLPGAHKSGEARSVSGKIDLASLLRTKRRPSIRWSR